jgi:hypothetical protein
LSPFLKSDKTFAIFQHDDVDDINDDDVKDILKSLQIGKASGGDFISHQMLKNTADTVYLPWDVE